jgi:hypothetical protein
MSINLVPSRVERHPAVAVTHEPAAAGGRWIGWQKAPLADQEARAMDQPARTGRSAT